MRLDLSLLDVNLWGHKILVYSARSPRRFHYFTLWWWPNVPESYAGSCIAAGRASPAKQLKGGGADKKGYPGLPGLGLSMGLKTLLHKKYVLLSSF